jgi:glycerol-3-phosphate dehydrogenase
VGLRPLVKPEDDDGNNTKSLSREHTVLVSRSGLVTVTGGKWTTYRAMAEDVLDRAFSHNPHHVRTVATRAAIKTLAAKAGEASDAIRALRALEPGAPAERYTGQTSLVIHPTSSA